MRQIARDLWQLSGFPPNAINVYLAGDVLIDAATRWAGRRMTKQLDGRKPSMLALTHVHPDHQGMARLICQRYAIPLACHAADLPVIQGEMPMQPENAFIRFSTRIWAGPPHAVTRVLQEGDEIAGFRVFEAPGHTPGHILLYRQADGVAIVGDVLNGMNLLTAWPGLHEPPAVFCTNVAENRRSIRRLAQLNLRMLCFGHGPPLRDMTRFDRFMKRLEPRIA